MVKDDKRSGLLGSSETVGWHVIAPFHLEDGDHAILVNRGWVPKDKVNPASRRELHTDSVQDLVGTVRLTESRQQFTPKNQPDSQKLHSRFVKYA